MFMRLLGIHVNDALAKSTVVVSFHTAAKTPESPACLGFFVSAVFVSAIA